MIRLLWVWLLGGRVASAQCLPSTTEGFVPLSQRQNITIYGVNQPIGFMNGNWDSGILYSKISQILTEEILGYNSIHATIPGTSGLAFQTCARDTTLHVCSELWDYVLATLSVDFNLANPEIALTLIQELPYSGTDGMFVFPKSYEPYYDATGKSLEFFRDLNASWGDYTPFFGDLADFDPLSLVDCNVDPAIAGDTAMDDYIRVTGDADAVQIVGGVRKWKCHNQDRWWLAPACRYNPTACVPLITNVNWAYNPTRQKAGAFNIALGMANTVTYGDYTAFPKTHKTFSYWWAPDITFKAEGAVKVHFPAYREDQYQQGNFLTDAADVPLMVYSHNQLGNAAPSVVSMLSEMRIYMFDVNTLLEEVVRATNAGSADPLTQVACEWVQQNEARWRPWIPVATSCPRSKGYGMVNENGDFVQARLPDAAACALCTPGRFADSFADDQGTSAVCSACAAGSAQDQGAQTECKQCEAGTYSIPSGTRCGMCPKGTYQMATSQTSCTDCKTPMTTSTVGMTTEDECICPEQTFRPCHDPDNGGQLRPECQCDVSIYLPRGEVSSRCLPCREGMDCPEGSDEKNLPCSSEEILNSTAFSYPVPKEGFFVEWDRPLWVFRCVDKPSCPGEMPSNCGEGLQGAACGACAAGYYKQGGKCYQCGDLEKNPLFLLVPLLMSPFGVLILHKVSQDDVSKWGKTTQGFGGIGYLMLVYTQSVSVILAIFPTVPATLSSGLGWSSTSAEITSLLRIECAGPSSFTENFLFNLFVPELLGLIFFVSWLIFRFIPKLRMDGDIVLGCFGGIIKTFFVTVASKCFSLFQCYSHPNGRRSMMSSPQILENSEEWLSMVGFSAVAILINCLAMLALFGWAMWTAPSKFHMVSFRRRWKFMIQKMRPSVYWWMMVILIKGLWLALTSVLWNTTMGQSMWISAGLLFYFTGSYVLLPWRSVFVALLDVAMHVSILLLCLLLPFLLDFDPEEAQMASLCFLVLAAISFVAVCSSVLFIIFKAVSGWYQKRREQRISYYAKRMSEVFSVAIDPRMLAELMTEIPALDILSLKYVATMMSAEVLGTHVAGRLTWGQERRVEAQQDKFVSGITRSQVTWA